MKHSGGKRYAMGGKKIPASQVDRIVKAEKDGHVGLNIEHPAEYYINMKNILKQLKFGPDVNLMQIRIYGEAVRQATPGSRPKSHSASSSHRSSSSSKKSSSSKAHPLYYGS
jgi:hypothetical protein